MSIFSFLHFIKKPLTETTMINGMNVKVFKHRNLLKILEACPNGSVIMINERTRVHVYHSNEEKI